MCEHVDNCACRVLDEESANAPWLVGKGIDDTQSAPHRLGVRNINRPRVANVNPETGLRILHSPRGNNDLSRGVGGRLQAENRIFHSDLEPEELDVELARHIEIISDGIRMDSLDLHCT